MCENDGFTLYCGSEKVEELLVCLSLYFMGNAPTALTIPTKSAQKTWSQPVSESGQLKNSRQNGHHPLLEKAFWSSIPISTTVMQSRP